MHHLAEGQKSDDDPDHRLFVNQTRIVLNVKICCVSRCHLVSSELATGIFFYLFDISQASCMMIFTCNPSLQ